LIFSFSLSHILR